MSCLCPNHLPWHDLEAAASSNNTWPSPPSIAHPVQADRHIKRSGDHNWRLLHGDLAMGTFVYYLDPVPVVPCTFCEQEILPCLPRWPPVVAGLCCPQHHLWHAGLGFLWDCVCFLYPIQEEKGNTIFLASFLLGQVKMATLKSHRNQLAGSGSNNDLQFFCFMVWVCIAFEFGYFTLQQHVDQFVSYWATEGALCKVADRELFLKVSIDPGL